ncbi:MAG: hypothetical protein NT062_06535 [Proteobacteria bacterium]|nr:hypothetical protein [Pseudomonadota bacterium]
MSLIDQLLDATPAPPAGEDPETLLAAFAEVEAARATILATATREPASTELRALLLAREAAWQQALVSAQAEVGGALIGTHRLRQYR